jgi:sporulation protein YlmC with PRC-barrel domain
MIRTLLTTTAMVALLQTGALAQSDDTAAPATDPAMTTEGTAATGAEADANTEATEETAEALPSDSIYDTAEAGDVLANRLIGTSVYNGTGDDAEAIGDINDIILSKDGQAEAVVIGVGGFLGIGEKNVAVQYDKVEVTGEKGDERFVLDASKESLEGAPAFDIAAMTTPDNAGMDNTAMNTTDTGMAPATDGTGMAAAPADPSATPAETAEAPADKTAAEKQAMNDGEKSDDMQTGAIDNDSATAGAEEKLGVDDRDAMQTMELGQVTADELTGAWVYNSNNESIGEIGEVILNGEQKVEGFVIDVGGFLGIGEKEVAVSASDLDFRRDESGDIKVFTPFTQEQLESQAAYDEDTYMNDKENGSLSATKS